MIHIAQIEGEDQARQLRDLLNEYLAFLRPLNESSGVDNRSLPSMQTVDDEMANLPGIFVPPRGRFLVALDDERVIGCVALKPLSATDAELKRMYVKPEYRGQRIGLRLVEALIAAAREAGFTKVVLDSHYKMSQAHRVYQGTGFRVIAPPDDAPDSLKKIAVFMELDLSSDEGG
jgi:GNAT superfamily N-acetyltransferase